MVNGMMLRSSMHAFEKVYCLNENVGVYIWTLIFRGFSTFVLNVVKRKKKIPKYVDFCLQVDDSIKLETSINYRKRKQLEKKIRNDIYQIYHKLTIGCTPLIQSPILYSAKEHVQKCSFGKFKTSWCTKIKHFLED